jgi:hypothetical protein
MDRSRHSTRTEEAMVLGWQDFVIIGIIVWALLDGRR